MFAHRFSHTYIYKYLVQDKQKSMYLSIIPVPKNFQQNKFTHTHFLYIPIPNNCSSVHSIYSRTNLLPNLSGVLTYDLPFHVYLHLYIYSCIRGVLYITTLYKVSFTYIQVYIITLY